MSLGSGNTSRVWACFGFAARLVVGGLFVVAAIGKIQDPEKFVTEIRAYELLPIALANAPAYILPWTELLVGAMLVLCLWRREARLVLVLMLVAFTAAKASALVSGLEIECGCSGNIAFLKPMFDSVWGLVTNVVLLLLLGVDHIAQRVATPRGARISVELGDSDSANPD